MKRINNIFQEIISKENLFEAYRQARKGKSHYKEVKIVDKNPKYYIDKLHEQLINKTFTTSEYKIFTINDKGKERVIYKLPFWPDRIVQWAIMLKLEPMFLNTFIHDTYAAIPNRGPHKALKRLHYFMNNWDETLYCLKIDIKKFFPSVDKEILKKLFKKKIKDKDLLWLLDDIIDSCDNGVAIGNYISQYACNLYLSYFDHWLKEEKKIKYMLHYMDDYVILHHDKKFLHQLKREMDEYLWNNLKLKIKDNWQVFPTYERGIDFVGYRSFGDYTLLRKSTSKNIKRKMRKLSKKEILTKSEKATVMSYNGWIKHCDSFHLKQKYIEPLIRKRSVNK